jgi:uroporphyrinogen decarboxylase
MIDEWGNVWGRLEGFSKGEVIRGVIEHDWAALDTYVFPRFDIPERYVRVKEIFAAHPDKFCIGGLPGFPFAIARYMRRMENFLADVLIEKENVMCLLNKIEDILIDCIDGLAHAGADAVMFGEDWGTQDRLLVSPKTWREMFKPGFVRLCEAVHDRGMTIFMHSCGHIYEIIEDLIEVGIDVLQFDQPEIHGVDNLARDFGGRINFWCPVDIQKTLQSKDPIMIENAARELVEKLGAFNGGFIAGYYGGNEAIGVDPQMQDIACKAFVKYGARLKNP